MVEGMNAMARIEIGKYLAADSRVCGGRLIFRGTRILVSDALDLSAAGYTAQAIASQYRGILSPQAVKEALKLTSQGLVKEVVPRSKTAA
jgi:uncharacterized protein (DUF433 family)